MAGYAKIWADIFNDDVFSKLSLAERGMWVQLFTYAKLCGDTPYINVRSYRTLGEFFGCDGRTANKILGKLSQLCAVEVEENESGISIFIKKYDFHQRLRKPDDRATCPVECNTNKTRPDKTRPDNYTSIVTLFNELCPSLDPVKEIKSGSSKDRALKARIGEHPDEQFWKDYFTKIESSDFLSGRKSSDWKATFAWIIGPKNMEKILDGTYDNRKGKSESDPDRYDTKYLV